MNKLQVEFSLSLNNRTGKYFAAIDMLEALESHVDTCRYWRLRFSRPPQGFVARALGRLMHLEVSARVKISGAMSILPRMRPSAAVLFTDPLQVLLYRLRSSDIVIVHDLGPLTHPAMYAKGVEALYLSVFERLAAVQPRLIFVSDSVRDEYLERYPGYIGLTNVIPNAVRMATFEGPTRALSPQPSKFFLTVGAVGARKNQAGLIRSFLSTSLPDEGYQLAIVGGPEPGFDEVRALAASTNSVLLLGYVDDEELRWLYQNSVGFALVSHLEGFGMPAAESIFNGLLPLVTDHGALAEVAGPSSLFASPGDPQSISIGLTRLARMGDQERRERLAVAKQHLRRFEPAAIRKLWRDFSSTLA